MVTSNKVFKGILGLTFLLFLSCVPDKIKEQLASGINEGQALMADQKFKAALGCIELHHLRYGQYPEEFSDIRFLNPFDSILQSFVEYQKLDSGYELNIKPDLFLQNEKPITLTYPDEFWKGLGCQKSNAKR